MPKSSLKSIVIPSAAESICFANDSAKSRNLQFLGVPWELEGRPNWELQVDFSSKKADSGLRTL